MHTVMLEDAGEPFREFVLGLYEGEEALMTVEGKPVARLLRLPKGPPYRKAGSAKGMVTMSDDFDEPLEDFKEYM